MIIPSILSADLSTASIINVFQRFPPRWTVQNSSATLFCDYWQLMVFCCTPAFKVVVDGGVNDSALV